MLTDRLEFNLGVQFFDVNENGNFYFKDASGIISTNQIITQSNINNIISSEDTVYVQNFEITSTGTTQFIMTDVVTGERNSITLSGGTLIITQL